MAERDETNLPTEDPADAPGALPLTDTSSAGAAVAYAEPGVRAVRPRRRLPALMVTILSNAPLLLLLSQQCIDSCPYWWEALSTSATTAAET